MNGNLKFKELRKYLSFLDKLSICMLETSCYENYQNLQAVPDKFNELYVYGIGLLQSEFEIVDELTEYEAKGKLLGEKKYFDYCIEIVLSETPKEVTG